MMLPAAMRFPAGNHSENDVCAGAQMMRSFADGAACGNEVSCGKWRLLNTSEIKANEKIRKY